MQTLMDTVIETFQAIGRQEQNASLIHMAAERLRELGMAVKTNAGVEYFKHGCPAQGYIDLAVIKDGVTVAVEVDHRRPRRNSVLKLREANAQFKLVILTSPRVLAEPPQPENGIDAIVTLDDAYPGRKLPPAGTAPRVESASEPLSARLRRAIELFIDCRDMAQAALLAGMEPAEFRRLLHREDVRAEFSRRAAIMEQATAELRARTGKATDPADGAIRKGREFIRCYRTPPTDREARRPSPRRTNAGPADVHLSG